VEALLIWSLLQAAVAEPSPLPIPDGWVQIPYEAYHGPEGAYHDRDSGAWIEYCICIPQLVGVPDWAVHPRNAVRSGQLGDIRYSEFTGGDLGRSQIAVSYHSADGRFVAFFRAEVPSEKRRARARSLLLGGTRIWERHWPGYSTPGRDAVDSDLRALTLGADAPTLYRVTGLVTTSKALASGGFAVQQLFRTDDRSRSHWRWLEFDQAQRLVKKGRRTTR
jgi:hypothetical protein